MLTCCSLRVTESMEKHLHVATNAYLMMCRVPGIARTKKRTRLGYRDDQRVGHVGEPPDISVSCIQWTRFESKCYCLSTGYFRVFYKQHGSLGSPIL